MLEALLHSVTPRLQAVQALGGKQPSATMMAARLAVLVAATRTVALKPLASPVVIGGTTGAVTAALYGKLQRMESVFDSGLGRPALVGSEKLVRQTDKILWRAYSMASVTPGDVVPKVDFIKFRGLLGSAAPLYFVDSTGFQAAASQKGLFDGLPNPFGGGGSKPKPKQQSSGGNLKLPNPFGSKNPLEALQPPNRNENFMGSETVKKSAPVPPAPETKPGAPDAQLLQALTTAPDGACYVLTSSEGVAACEEALAKYPSLKATIIAPANGVSLSSDGDWVSARPQDLEGELVAPVSIGESGDGSLDVQDLAEVAIQASLRLSRDAERRIIRVVSSGGAAATRQNENYFTNLGGEGAKKREGDVTSVDWTATFSVLEEDVEVLKSPEEKDWAAGTYR